MKGKREYNLGIRKVNLDLGTPGSHEMGSRYTPKSDSRWTNGFARNKSRQKGMQEIATAKLKYFLKKSA